MTGHVCGPSVEGLLFTPAPNPVGDEVWSAMRSASSLPSGGPALDAILRRLHAALAEVAAAPHHLVLTQTGTATAAIESAVRATTRAGDTVAVVSNGQFGERIARVVTAVGRGLRAVEIPWGAPTDSSLDEVRESARGAALVAAVHYETSTGVLNDAGAICRAVREVNPGALILLDVVSSIVDVEVNLDAWGVDIAVCGSGKGLGSLPGSAFSLVNSRAIGRAATGEDSYASSWQRLIEAATGPTADVFLTPSIPVLAGAEAHLTGVADLGAARHRAKRALVHKVLHESTSLRPIFPGPGVSCGPVVVYEVPDAADLQGRLASIGLHIGRGQGALGARAVRLSWFGHGLECVDELSRRLRALGAAS